MRMTSASGELHFDPLLEAGKTVASGLERIVPDGSASVQAVLDDADLGASAQSSRSRIPGHRSANGSRRRVPGTMPQLSESP